MRIENPSKSWQSQLRPLGSEVEAVKKAAGTTSIMITFTLNINLHPIFDLDQDELVKVIADSLPETAKARGVYTENALRERFIKVEEMARRLALVPEKDASMITYGLSYLQSMLIMQPKELISKAELNNEPVDFTQLNTYEILNRTRFVVCISVHIPHNFEIEQKV